MSDTPKHHEGEMYFQAWKAWQKLGGFETDIEEFMWECKTKDACGYSLRVQDYVDGFRDAFKINNELLKDKARLDWLDNHVGLYDVAEYFRHDLLTHKQRQSLTLREGIDEAMERESRD